jgi:hypothetical protein
MAERLTMDCTQHASPYECTNQLVIFVPKLREYGLIIHDGGESFVLIQHCPWCGSRLPRSGIDGSRRWRLAGSTRV